MKISEFKDSVEITNTDGILIEQTFDCGQTFRFDPDENGIVWGEAMGRYVGFEQLSPDAIRIHNTCRQDVESIWLRYLALDVDYNAVRNEIASIFKGDDVMSKAMEQGRGIRILRQDPWEAVCSFIVSQNNNIPRIKKIIAAMSERYGDEIETPYGVKYAFPSAKALFDAGEDEIFALRTGFRAKYIYDASKKVHTGELDLASVYASDTQSAIDMLCTVKGIGLKVASCALLFGFDKTDVFPIDVWIKRILAQYYPDGIDIASLGKYAGLIQQYLFYYARWQ